MDFSKGKQYCEDLCSGMSEEEIIKRENISIQELYRVVEYADIQVARKHLKYFCDGYINYLCLCWPGREEALCPVSGHEPDCPLQNNKGVNEKR